MISELYSLRREVHTENAFYANICTKIYNAWHRCVLVVRKVRASFVKPVFSTVVYAAVQTNVAPDASRASTMNIGALPAAVSSLLVVRKVAAARTRRTWKRTLPGGK